MLALLIESSARSLGLGIVTWGFLRLVQLRDVRTRALLWTAVLLTALAMPALMQASRWISVPAPRAAMAFLPDLVLSAAGTASESRANGPLLDWTTAILGVYLIITTVGLLRMVFGLLLSQRLRSSAIPLKEAWASGWDVRATPRVHVPVTIGSTILLPEDYSDWSTLKREAVLQHEQAHVRRRDFYLQLLARVHRATFWFSPLAWWLPRKLAELAELASDDLALRAVRDREGYAEVLLEFARKEPGFQYSSVGMARSGSVGRRVERILAWTEADRRTPRYVLPLLAVLFLLVAGFSAGSSWSVQAQVPSVVPQAPAAAPQAPPPATTPAPQVRPQPVEASRAPDRSPEEEIVDALATKEEREALTNLQGVEERVEFIRQFWLRRDPEPTTAPNEFKDEAYRRVQYATEHFSSASRGWKTERGLVYLAYGPPDEKETHAQGGIYFRDIKEGGGTTTTLPFEVWRYRFVDGIGRNIRLEFVDSARNGDYRLQLDPSAKEALPEVRPLN